MTSAAIAADVRAARAEIDRCAAKGERFTLRTFLRTRGGGSRVDSVARRFATTYGMTTLAMSVTLRSGGSGADPKMSTATGRAKALREHIDGCVQRGEPVRKGAFAQFIKGTGAKCDNAVRTAFARLYQFCPKDYYLAKLVERARFIRAERPAIGRGWLGVRLGVDDAMVDRVIAKLGEQGQAA